MEDLTKRIQIKQIQLNGETDPVRKQKLQLELKALQYEKEVKDIRLRIKRLG